jgi:sugar phosphate permease
MTAHGSVLYCWMTWMPTYFRTAHHFTFNMAGYLYSLSWVFVLVSVFIVAFISDKIVRRAPFVAGGLIIAGILFYVGGNVISAPYTALAVLIIALCCLQPAITMIQALFQSVVPEKSIPMAMGVATGTANIVLCASPAIGGLLLQAFGFGAVMTYISSVAVVGGISALFLVREGY